MLFTFAGGAGHFEPLVAIARSAAAAGHVVAFSGEPVLAEPGYRRAAQRLRDEIARLPGPEQANVLLERLAADKRPFSRPGPISV